MKHDKHPPIGRLNLGEFGRTELGFIGAPCGDIQKLAAKLTESLSDLDLAYIDAGHNPEDAPSTYTSAPFESVYHYDKQSFISNKEQLDFDGKIIFSGHDIVLVNGNHFKTNRQAIFIHPSKLDSVKRKLDRIDNVDFFILTDGHNAVPSFLRDHLSNGDAIPSYQVDDLDKISSHVRSLVSAAPVKGLVLAGGKSTRMGKDKGLLKYHGKPQREWMYDVLDDQCDSAFLSCRRDQLDDLDPSTNTVVDRLIDFGPFGAIMSAFMTDPQCAWLVVACDIPGLSESVIKDLVEARDPSKVATAYRSPVSGFPEPLVAIWEPRSYQRLLSFLGLGYSCPRKVLINSDVKVINVKDPDILRNVNTPEDLERAMSDKQ